MVEIEYVRPEDIEKNSFRTITEELEAMQKTIPAEYASVVKRVIHTTADFEYADTMCFSKEVLSKIKDALKNGAHIVTDTNMVMSGINKNVVQKLGGEVHCFMADEDVIKASKERNCTRAMVSMEKAADMEFPVIFAIGNAPTALICLYELIQKGYQPVAVIGVPVGFVNVVQSKELIMESGVPYIVNRGRKGGSNVAAAICNALLYELDQSRGGNR